MIRTKNYRLGEEKYNYQGYLMRIVEYNNANDIVVEFQDEYKGKTHTSYQHFITGRINNPYHQNVYNVGMIGDKYPTCINGKATKEYGLWKDVLKRCFCENYKKKCPTYENVTCCDEWLLFEKFYEWLHSQPNFDKWLNGGRWCIDKDILIKGNKTYSYNNCTLVPQNVNTLFVKNDATRGNLPIGVVKHGNKFLAVCINPFT